MLLHLIGTEQFRSKGQFIASILLCRIAPAEARPHAEKGAPYGLAAYPYLYVSFRHILFPSHMTKMNQTRAITCAIGSRPGTRKARHPFFGYQKEFEMLNQAEEHNSLQDTFRPCRIYAWTQDTGTLFDRLLW
jgi:hypothetical protein